MTDDPESVGDRVPAIASLNAIEAVSFDLDDTLWHCAPAISRAEEALFDWHTEVTPAITRMHCRESLQEHRATLHAGFPELKGDVTALRVAGLRALLAEFGYPETLAEEGFGVFYRARSEVDLYEGVHDLLASLKTRYRLAAITNGNADLELIGIADYFDVIFSADLELAAKPGTAMFHRCLAHMELPGPALLHIGDNPVADVQGGLKAGVQTLWFNQYNDQWPEHLQRPHFQAQSLSQIAALLVSGIT